MKFNKWTVALAAVGVVSLASAAKAEEKASTAVTALTPTSISGYVDTSAEWNLGTGDANVPPYKFNSPSKADGFNLDVIQLRIEKALDESEWASGYRVDLWMGPDANTLGTSSTWDHYSNFAIRQAYVALRTPVGNGIDWKVGVFDSIIGYESVESPNDPNFTRSYGHSIEPQTETGVLASYRFCDMFSASFGIADTVGPQINGRAFYPVVGNQSEAESESYKSYMGSIALTAPDSMGFLAGSTLYAGIVNGFSPAVASGYHTNGVVTSYYVGTTVATPVTGLRLGASFDDLNIAHINNDTYSFAGYASFQATEKLSLHARAEYFKDKPGILGTRANPGQGVLFDDLAYGQKAEVLALTATVQYDLWKNVISRLEFRWDHSLLDNALFGESINSSGNYTSAPSRDNACMVAANIIYKF
jgi:hypothetical protein